MQLLKDLANLINLLRLRWAGDKRLCGTAACALGLGIVTCHSDVSRRRGASSSAPCSSCPDVHRARPRGCWHCGRFRSSDACLFDGCSAFSLCSLGGDDASPLSRGGSLVLSLLGGSLASSLSGRGPVALELSEAMGRLLQVELHEAPLLEPVGVLELHEAPLLRP